MGPGDVSNAPAASSLASSSSTSTSGAAQTISSSAVRDIYMLI